MRAPTCPFVGIAREAKSSSTGSYLQDRTYNPTGRIKLHGSVPSILADGTNFTGRELFSLGPIRIGADFLYTPGAQIRVGVPSKIECHFSARVPLGGGAKSSRGNSAKWCPVSTYRKQPNCCQMTSSLSLPLLLLPECVFTYKISASACRSN